MVNGAKFSRHALPFLNEISYMEYQALSYFHTNSLFYNVQANFFIFYAVGRKLPMNTKLTKGLLYFTGVIVM